MHDTEFQRLADDALENFAELLETADAEGFAGVGADAGRSHAYFAWQ